MEMTEDEALERLLDAVETVIGSWSFYPEESFGKLEATEMAFDLGSLAEAYRGYKNIHNQ